MMVVEAEGSCCRIAHRSDALEINAMTAFQACQAHETAGQKLVPVSF